MSDAPVANRARQVPSNHLRSLGSVGERFDHGLIGELERSVEQINDQKPWNEGWILIKGIIRLNGNQMEPESFSRLQRLSVRLEPISLLERARAYALANQRLHFDLEDDYVEEENAAPSLWERVQTTARHMGAEVAQNDDILEELLPELVSKRSVRLRAFGKGLADGSVDRKSWCKRAPETRYPLIVSPMQTYYKPEKSEELRWRPILFTILEKAPILQAVLTQIEQEIYPTSWSGSLANTMAKRLTLFAQLSEHSNIKIRDWAIMQLKKLEVAVCEQREHESKKNQERFERFE